jgi:hypothetical protein
MDKFPKGSRMNLIPRGIQRDSQRILGRLGLPEGTKPLYTGTMNDISEQPYSRDANGNIQLPSEEVERRRIASEEFLQMPAQYFPAEDLRHQKLLEES